MFVSQDKWLDALGRLRRTHLEQTQTFYVEESKTLAEFNHRSRLRLAEASTPLGKAIVITEFVSDLKRFKHESNRRKRALRRGQAEEVYNLLLFKFSLVSGDS